MSLSDEMIRASRFARDPRLGEVLVDLKLDKRFAFGIGWVEFHGVTYEPAPDGGRCHPRPFWLTCGPFRPGWPPSPPPRPAYLLIATC